MEDDRVCLLRYSWATYSDWGLVCLWMAPALAPPQLAELKLKSYAVGPQQHCCSRSSWYKLLAWSLTPELIKPEMRDHTSQGQGLIRLPSLSGAPGLWQVSTQAAPHTTCWALEVTGPSGSRPTPSAPLGCCSAMSSAAVKEIAVHCQCSQLGRAWNAQRYHPWANVSLSCSVCKPHGII